MPAWSRLRVESAPASATVVSRSRERFFTNPEPVASHTGAMRHAALSMRWWLALAFAGIAAVTALSVAQVLTARSEAAIRERARELAGGTALTAAAELSSTRSREHARTLAAQLGASREVSLFVLDDHGALLTPARAGGITVTSLPNYRELRETALGGRRRTGETGRSGADHRDAFLPGRLRHGIEIELAPRDGIDEAARSAAREDVIEAGLIARNADVYFVRFTSPRFAHEMRIGEPRPRHGDEIGCT